jgi:hypothetical protein
LLRGKEVRLQNGPCLNQFTKLAQLLSLISLTYNREVIVLAVKKELALVFFARFSLGSYLNVGLFQTSHIILDGSNFKRGVAVSDKA